MKRILSLLVCTIIIMVCAVAQQSERVDLVEASSAITSTINGLNSLYQELNKRGKIDSDISENIRNISSMAFPCRETIVNATHNVSLISNDKKKTVVTMAKDIEIELTLLDRNSSKESIIANLKSVEEKMMKLLKILDIKFKKSSK